jgi:beta-galactosidase
VKTFTLLQPPSEQRLPDFPIDGAAHQPSTGNLIGSASADWPGEYIAKGWADILELAGAKPLFHYQKDFYAGQPAVTIASYGKGKVIYVGTLLEPKFYGDLARHACAWANLDPGPEIPEGMDFALRQKNEKPFRFLLNFSDSAQTVAVSGSHRDLLSEMTFVDHVTVPPLELRILVPNPS